jgi:hypothetical protein
MDRKPEQGKYYLVYRHGSNSANQSMCGVAPIGIYSASDPEDAKHQAMEHHTVYNNQYLSVVEESEADPEDWDYVCEIEMMESTIIPADQVGCMVCGVHPHRDLTLREARDYVCDRHGGTVV